MAGLCQLTKAPLQNTPLTTTTNRPFFPIKRERGPVFVRLSSFAMEAL